MRHLVIGLGNLGLDLKKRLLELGHEVDVSLGRIMDLSYRDWNGDVLWCTAGAGGPTNVPSQIANQVKTHCLLTADICSSIQPHTRAIFFSTHYLNKDPDGTKSIYALTKVALERIAMKRPKTTVYRVGSLYGTHFPEKTFPGKVAPKLARGEIVSLPENTVTPTPTDWLARELAQSVHDDGVFNFNPAGSTSVLQWGMSIERLLKRGHVSNQGWIFDRNYPVDSSGTASSRDTWDKLWDERKQLFIPPDQDC